MRGIIDMKRTGKRIRELCEAKGLSPQDVADMMGLAEKRTVYFWYAGDRLPSIDNLFMLSRILGTTIDDLFVEKEENNEEVKQ